jgi:predicted DsbA family dithiol-disulfide isomerase
MDENPRNVEHIPMSDASPRSSDSPTKGPPPVREEPVSGPLARAWGLIKLFVVFAVGIGVGYSLAAGRLGPRVVYSGAMTEMEGRAVHGPDDAPVTIVEYTDYECSFCRRYNRLILPEILDEYEGRIRYIVRHFPLVGLHPAAVGAAVAAVCAERQGSFWEYHDRLFAQEKGLSTESLLAYAQETGLREGAFRECLDDEETSKVVQDDMQRGAEYGVRGTPAFFINGRVVMGAQPLEAFRKTIDAALEDAAGD